MCYTNRRNAEKRVRQENAEKMTYEILLKKKEKIQRILAKEKNRVGNMKQENQDLHNEIRELNVKIFFFKKILEREIEENSRIEKKD